MNVATIWGQREMIRWTLQGLMKEYQEHTGEYLSIRKLACHTGIAPSSICTAMASKTTRADFRTMERLLQFFGETLEKPLTVADLLEYVPEQSGN